MIDTLLIKDVCNMFAQIRTESYMSTKRQIASNYFCTFKLVLSLLVWYFTYREAARVPSCTELHAARTAPGDSCVVSSVTGKVGVYLAPNPSFVQIMKSFVPLFRLADSGGKPGTPNTLNRTFRHAR